MKARLLNLLKAAKRISKRYRVVKVKSSSIRSKHGTKPSLKNVK